DDQGPAVQTTQYVLGNSGKGKKSAVDQALSAGSASGNVTFTRPQSEGESFGASSPPPAPIIEVGPGGTCGTTDANGNILSLQPRHAARDPLGRRPGMLQPGAEAPPRRNRLKFSQKS